MQPLRWLYLDLNSYFASVEQQRHPHLRGKPIAVGPERIDSGTIIAASYEAKAYGIHTGMRVGEARRLCPQLTFCGGDHSHYKAYHDRILEEVGRHIPVTHVCSIDEVACRLLDNENSPEQALALARRIKAGIRARVGECLTSSIGIAPSRLIAKIASDMRKPDGLTLIEARDLPGALLALKLRDIPGIGAKMESRLNARGIHSMADLLAQDSHGASVSWGSVVGTRLWYELHGRDMPERAQQSRSIGHSHVIAPDLRSPDTARETARRLLLKAASRLRRAECVTRHLTLHARFQRAPSWHATLKIAPTDDSFPLLDALNQLWPRLLREIGREPIRVIGVTLDDIRPAVGTQLNLFDAPPRPTLRIARAMDSLNEKFGRNTVTLGSVAKGRAGLIGTKIAFGRIPDNAEFHE